MPMAHAEERENVADYLNELYALAGFSSWGEFAREAGFLASSMSDWKRGKNAPSGPNLLRLIQAATDRAPLAMREAAEHTSPLHQVRSHLATVEEKVDGALIGIADILDLLREAPGRSEADAPRESRP